MHDDPRTDATDPADLTQRHSIEPGDPATAAPVTPPTPEPPVATDPNGAPADTWTTPASAEGTAPLDRFTPAPEPRSEWARSWEQTPPVTPERWYEPAPAAVPTTAASPAPETGRSRGRGGSLIAVSLLSAVLASGGTVLALGATGALDRPSASRARAFRWPRTRARPSRSPSTSRPPRSRSPPRSAPPSCGSR